MYRGVCTTCNGALGPLDEELLRSSPVALRRRLAGAGSTRRGENVDWSASKTAPAPKFLRFVGDAEEIVHANPQNPNKVKPVDQISLKLDDGEWRHITVFPNMTESSLQKKLDQGGIDIRRVTEARTSADVENFKHFDQLRRRVVGEGTLIEEAMLPPGNDRVPGRVFFQVTELYYRCLAKIALHYYLLNNRLRYTGHEAVFQPIIRYIRDGEENEQIHLNQGPDFAYPLGHDHGNGPLTTKRWMNLICAYESGNQALVGLYLVFGPSIPPKPTFIQVHRSSNRLILPEFTYGHRYIYPSDETGREAFVERVRFLN